MQTFLGAIGVGMGIGKETKTARRWVYVVEWGAVRDSD